ncbi:ARABIDOPSIS ARIADNE 8, ARIADNE 8 [Hibiscus trionum]|uniref:RBR-type E3 ubiquitin transferase n=1 Tax=Hibiscus trionum TaxID=183268 RepID=A0A9W7M8D9_HIBTR|nr:ARABIDOPSIS ARIADNE 8, ARIADNE 8 [Hibiscus trionum]
MADSNVDDAYDDDYFYHDDTYGDDYSYHGDTDDDLHPLQGSSSHGDDHGDSDDDNALEEDESDDLPTFRQNCTVLTEADIRRRVTDTIAEVSSVLSLSRMEAGTLLLRYKWSVSNVFDAWFADEKLAREKAGLFLKPLIELPDHGGSVLCEICFEYYPCDGLKSASCGHPYCNGCWTSYIKISIADGPQSLLLKCPHPSCHAAVGEDMVSLFASEQENNKYSGYFVMSYIESNKMIKWCPGPGCENAVEFVAGSESFSVSCLCSHSFCWNCSEEAHRPVDCETVLKWMLQNSSESENVTYILAFTKPCPKCKRPIEKNMGCSHMTCRDPCYFEFCWLCLKDWRNHDVCNRFKGNPEKEKKEKAKKYMMKYAHYFERWATNKKSMIKAADDLQNVQSEQIEIVRRIQEKSAAEISFIPEAWQQIIECRRVLAWTYAYGFYLPDECQAKRNLFEYLQGQAESGLERLHDCAEKVLLPFLQQKRSTMEFIDFRKKLTLLTSVTRKFFDNLVTALQNGLSDVNSEGKMISTAATLTGAPDFNTNINTATATSMEPWACAYCSFENEGSSTFCTVCGRGSRICDVCTFANSKTSTTCAMCSEALEL